MLLIPDGLLIVVYLFGSSLAMSVYLNGPPSAQDRASRFCAVAMQYTASKPWEKFMQNYPHTIEALNALANLLLSGATEKTIKGLRMEKNESI